MLIRLGVAAALIILVVGASFIVRDENLRGLPDIGDPFDTTKFGHFDVPDKDNAFVEYSQAALILPPAGMTLAVSEQLDEVTKDGWSKAGPELKAWLSVSQPALQIWRNGTEKPHALALQPNALTISAAMLGPQRLREFGGLATAEAARLEMQGKMDEAYGWYRAILRCSRHSGNHGTFMERLIGIALHGDAVNRIDRWARDSRTDAKMLRKALVDVQDIDRMTPPISESIKSDYYMNVNSIQDPDGTKILQRTAGRARSTSFSFSHLVNEIGRYIGHPYGGTKLFFRNEPERSGRVLRLIYANVLSHCDDPVATRPRRAETELPLFETGPADPLAARSLPPKEIQKWYETAVFAKNLGPALDTIDQIVHRERGRQAAIILTLAEQLYRREHGGLAPKSPKELIGPSLKRLPEGIEPTD